MTVVVNPVETPLITVIGDTLLCEGAGFNGAVLFDCFIPFQLANMIHGFQKVST